MPIAENNHLHPSRNCACVWLLGITLFLSAPLRVDSADTPPTTEADDAVSAADSTRKYRYLAKTARERKEHDKALRYYGLLLKYDPGYAAGHYFRGKIFAERKEYGRAKEAALAAIGADSLHVNANDLLCQLYLAEGKADSSRVYVNRIRRFNGGRYRPLQRRVADALRRQGLTPQAIEQYEDLVSAHGDSAMIEAGSSRGVEAAASQAELYDLLATLYTDIGKSDEALNWRRRLLAHQERRAAGPAGDRIETLQEMAALQEETGSYDQALLTLGQLAQIDSANNYPYYSRMAEIAVRTRRPETRRTALAGMVAANPRDVESAAALAEMFLADEEPETAEKWVDRGLATVRRDAHLQLLKGDIMASRGLEEQAIAAYEIALDDPDWRGVAQQRIWQLRPPETEEEKLKRAFFGDQ